MPKAAPVAVFPRKSPRQARALVTLDAIFEATLQVLIRDGTARLTTTRVAERAGVSVGTMYQYFPNKVALIHALNARYLDDLAARIEATCHAHHGLPMGQMIEAVVDTYWLAKTDKPDVTRALYRSVAELDNSAMIADFAARVDQATRDMLASTPDPLSDPDRATLTLLTVIFGTVRNAFERNLPEDRAQELRAELVSLCLGWLATQRPRP